MSGLRRLELMADREGSMTACSGDGEEGVGSGVEEEDKGVDAEVEVGDRDVELSSCVSF